MKIHTVHIRKWQRLSYVTCLIILAASNSACSSLGNVAAWEKGYLAKAEMRFDHDRLSAKNADHIYTSKEAATGSGSVGGGGCGCN
ncbi:DUF4266 domain-containing protein [Undibacterium sp. Di24W]|uniref:DUF4266 domain-containing protein n=1 Tax=Undibacterium sp. Di24W TaxID=3413033 RepID=UPI003BF2BA20